MALGDFCDSVEVQLYAEAVVQGQPLAPEGIRWPSMFKSRCSGCLLKEGRSRWVRPRTLLCLRATQLAGDTQDLLGWPAAPHRPAQPCAQACWKRHPKRPFVLPCSGSAGVGQGHVWLSVTAPAPAGLTLMELMAQRATEGPRPVSNSQAFQYLKSETLAPE